MSATDRLLDQRWKQLETDLAELAQVRRFLAEHEESERAARDLLSNLEAARTYADVLARLAEQSRTALEDARTGTGWQPPAPEPSGPTGTQLLPVAPDDATALQHLSAAEMREAVGE